MLSKLLAVAALCVAGLTGFAFDPPEYNGSFTRQGVSYAQRGGLGARDYVVTNIVVNGQPRPLPPYLYLMELDDTYPDDAEWYYQHADYRDGGHCSVRRSGNAVERNYDWHFDDAATFVLKVGGAEGRFASVGVANVGTNLTDSFVRSGAWSLYYKCLAGHTTDGINENGLVAEVNVTSGSWGRTSGAVHGLGAVRWALDHGTNAQQAAEFLAANVYLPQGFGVNFHYLIADATKTFIVENCEAHEVTNAPAVMTNFNLDRQGGEGYERYASLTNGATTIESQWWTLAYNPATRPVRSSDLGGEAAQIWAAWNDGRTKEQHRGESFGGVTWWQTVHCSKYDIQTLTLRIAVQEITDWYAFTVPTVGKVKSVNGRVGEVVLDAAAVNALPDDKDELVGNDNFKEAVATVSPPVELPAKWALANVTNANGGAVGAADVGAVPLTRDDDGSVTSQLDSQYWTIYADQRKRIDFSFDEVDFRMQADGQNWIEISPNFIGYSYKDTSGTTHRKSLFLDGVISKSDVLDHLIETLSGVPVDSGAVLGELRSNWLSQSAASQTYLTKQEANDLATKQYAQTEATNAFKCATNAVTVLHDAKSNGFITGGGEVWAEVNRQSYWIETSQQVRFNQVEENLWYGDVIYVWYNHDKGWFCTSPDIHEPTPSHSQTLPPTADEFTIQGHDDIHFVRHWIPSAPVLKGTVATVEEVAEKRDMTDFDIHGEGWSFDPLLPLITALDVSQYEFRVHMEDEWTPYSFEIEFRYKTAGSSWNKLAESNETYPTVEAIHAATEFTIGGDGQIFYPQFSPWNGKKIYKGGVVDHIASSNWVARAYVPTSRKVNGQELTQDITIEGMTDNALVLTNGAVKTKGGAAVGAGAVGALPQYNPVAARLLTVTNENATLNPEIRLTRNNANGTATNFRLVQTSTAPVINHSTGGGDWDIKVPSANGTIALRNSFSLEEMLVDANTNQTAHCESISTNICKLAAPAITNAVIYTRDRFYDAELDVTWKRTVSGGRIFYDIEAVGNSTED